MSDLVEVYIECAEYESPYNWEWSDMWNGKFHMNVSDKDSIYWIPREQYDRWVAAQDAFDQVQDEMNTLKLGLCGTI